MLHELKEKNGKKLCMVSASNSVAFLKIMYIIDLYMRVVASIQDINGWVRTVDIYSLVYLRNISIELYFFDLGRLSLLRWPFFYPLHFISVHSE